MALPSYDDLVKSDLPSYEELTGSGGKSLPSYDELVSEPRTGGGIAASVSAQPPPYPYAMPGGMTEEFGGAADPVMVAGATSTKPFFPIPRIEVDPTTPPPDRNAAMPGSMFEEFGGAYDPRLPAINKQGLAALTNQAAGVAEFAESPAGLTLAPVAGADAALGRLASAGFSVDMVRGLPEQVKAYREAKTPQEQMDAATGIVATVGFALTAGTHAVKGHAKVGEVPKPEESNSPNVSRFPQETPAPSEVAQTSPVNTQSAPPLPEPQTASLDNPALARFRPEPQPEVTASPVEQSTPKQDSGLKEASPESVDVSGQNKRPLSFVTSKGSEYTLHEDGTTTRNKSVHPEHPGDEGIKPRSEATFYVGPGDLPFIGEIQAKGGTGRRILAEQKPGVWGVKYVDGPNAGKFERRTLTEVESTPSAGMYPVEVWDGGKSHHFGNEITEVREPPSVPNVTEEQVAPPVSQKDLGIKEPVEQSTTPGQNTGEPTSTNRVGPPDTSTVGIAHEYGEERFPDQIERGEGTNVETQVARGRELLTKGTDPNQIVRRVERTGKISADDMAVLRAQTEVLQHASDTAAEAARTNPGDLVLQRAADQAMQNELAWRKAVKPAATEFHKIGMTLQGQAEVNYGTFEGLRRSAVDLHGKDVTPAQAGELKNVATRVRRETQLATESMQRATGLIERRFGKKAAPRSVEQLRNDLANRIRKLTPCE